MAALLTGTSRIDSAAQFVTVLLAFIFVLAITLVGTRLIGNYQKKQSFSKNFEIIEGYRVANNKFLELVRIGKRYYVLAIGKEELSLIAEVEEEELELMSDEAQASGAFGRLLSKTKDKLQNKGDRSDEET